jgi:hypothetical protein
VCTEAVDREYTLTLGQVRDLKALRAARDELLKILVVAHATAAHATAGVRTNAGVEVCVGGLGVGAEAIEHTDLGEAGRCTDAAASINNVVTLWRIGAVTGGLIPERRGARWWLCL